MPSVTRRQLLVSIGTTASGLSGCLSREQPSGEFDKVDGSWSMVGQDPAHSRRVEDGPSTPDPVWTTAPAQARSVGTPSLSDGALYVPVDAVSSSARHRYRIHALSATTGEERWQVPLRAEPTAPPAVSGDRIVATARPSLERGRIVCFRKRDGSEKWLVDVDARVTAPPTIAAGTVYVPDWRGRVHALAVGDGTVQWSRNLSAETDGGTFSEPVAVRDGTLYVGSLSGKTGVVALDAGTGDERWRVSTGAVTGGPIVAGDLVVVRSHQQVLAFDTDGTQRWSATVLAADARPMAVDDEHVYVPANDRLHAIRRDGEPGWKYEPSDGQVGTPTVAGNRVLVRGKDRLVALSASAGESQWTARPNGVGRAVVTPDAVFLSGSDGRLLAFGEQ